MKKKLAVRILIVMVLISISIAGCGKKEEIDEVLEEEPLAVATMAVTEGLIEEVIELTGAITAQQTVNIVPKTAGRVVEAPVKVGQKVNKGDVILRLEAEELSVQLQQAEAGLAVAEANLAAIKAGARPQELAQAKNALAQAEANYYNKKENLTRMESLFAGGAISLQQLEGAKLELVGTETGYYTAQEKVSLLEAGATKENLAVVEAQVKQAAAGVAMVRTQLNNTIITAPISGVISNINIAAGELAGTGMLVATIVQLDIVEVDINVSERNINQVQKDDQIKVVINAVDRAELTGTVYTVSPIVNRETRQFPVKIRVENKEALLKPGMFAQVYLVTGKEEQALKIPKEAVITTAGQNFVFVVTKDRAVKKEIEVGLANNSQIEVVSGLTAADEVVIKGQHQLQDEQLVVVENGGEK